MFLHLMFPALPNTVLSLYSTLSNSTPQPLAPAPQGVPTLTEEAMHQATPAPREATPRATSETDTCYKVLFIFYQKTDWTCILMAYMITSWISVSIMLYFITWLVKMLVKLGLILRITDISFEFGQNALGMCKYVTVEWDLMLTITPSHHWL